MKGLFNYFKICNQLLVHEKKIFKSLYYIINQYRTMSLHLCCVLSGGLVSAYIYVNTTLSWWYISTHISFKVWWIITLEHRPYSMTIYFKSKGVSIHDVYTFFLTQDRHLKFPSDRGHDWYWHHPRKFQWGIMVGLKNYPPRTMTIYI